MSKKTATTAYGEQITVEEQGSILCDSLSFAGAEAYKRLRTNLLLSFPEKQQCRVLGITSAVRGEGKSVTAINLAYTFAQTGKKVLLVEADMRLPNHAKRLGLKETPGLSNLLVGMAKGSDVLQRTQQLNNFYVITAGDVPPNPSELLGAERMKECIQAFTESFDIVIVDLPPVDVVTDALTISRQVDGFVFVVRQEYSERALVARALDQLSIVEARILGIVMNQAIAKGKNYRYHKKYDSYHYEYGEGVQKNADAEQESEEAAKEAVEQSAQQTDERSE